MAKQKKTIQNDKITNISINNQIGNEAEEDLKKKHPIKYIFAISTGVLVSITAIIPFIMSFTNQELITKGTYVLKEDIESKYISIELYNEVKKISKEYEISLSEKESKINELQNELNYQKEWLKRYDALIKERDGFEKELANYNNFAIGIVGYSKDDYQIKKEELLRKIANRDEQIKNLLETINSIGR